MEPFFRFLAANPFILLFFTVGMAVLVGKFSVKGYQIYEASLPKGHPLLAEAAHNLALAMKESGQLDEAEKLNLGVIDVRAKQARAKHQLGMSFNNLGDVQHLQGSFADAEASYVKAIEVLRKTLGDHDPYVAVALENLARTYGEMGEWAKAFKSMNESRRILRHHAQFVLPYLNDQDQLNFLNVQDRRNRNLAMSLAAASLVFVVRSGRTGKTAAVAVLVGAVVLGIFGAAQADLIPGRLDGPPRQDIVIELADEGDTVILQVVR